MEAVEAAATIKCEHRRVTVVVGEKEITSISSAVCG